MFPGASLENHGGEEEQAASRSGGAAYSATWRILRRATEWKSKWLYLRIACVSLLYYVEGNSYQPQGEMVTCCVRQYLPEQVRAIQKQVDTVPVLVIQPPFFSLSSLDHSMHSEFHIMFRRCAC
jgi:hypothetical protein